MTMLFLLYPLLNSGIFRIFACREFGPDTTQLSTTKGTCQRDPDMTEAALEAMSLTGNALETICNSVQHLDDAIECHRVSHGCKYTSEARDPSWTTLMWQLQTAGHGKPQTTLRVNDFDSSISCDGPEYLLCWWV